MAVSLSRGARLAIALSFPLLLGVGFMIPRAVPTASTATANEPGDLGPLRAFPGAQGFGADATGGRGGRVIKVTNRNSSGPGSLRDCILATGPRTCVFEVGGTITLTDHIATGAENSDLTIAGQTAPGGGIQVRGGRLRLQDVDDVVVRHVRFRLGDELPGDSQDADVVEVVNARRVVLDHVSIAWGVDENLALDSVRDVTVSNSIITEGLHESVHSEGPHGYCAFQKGSRETTWYRNLISHCERRFPQMSDSGAHATSTVVANNVIHDYVTRGSTTAGSDRTHRVDILANFYRRSPSSDRQAVQLEDVGSRTRVYLQGNIGPTDNAPRRNQWSLTWGDNSSSLRASSPLFPNHVPVRPASEAREFVLDNAGAWPRDAMDTRVVNRARTLDYGLVDRPGQVGGWPTLASGSAPADRNDDGIPDSWNAMHGFGASADIATQQVPGAAQGWTWLDAYLHDRHLVVAEQ